MTSEAVRHAWIELAPAEKAYERTRGGPYGFGSALGMTRLADGFALQLDAEVLAASQGSPLQRSGRD